jgi:polar amino acid transport system substrate-binding protein
MIKFLLSLCKKYFRIDSNLKFKKITNNSKIILYTIFLVIVVCFGYFYDNATLNDKKIIKVGTSEFPPFEYTDNKQKLNGFDIELLNYILKDYKIEYENMDFGGLIIALNADKIDIIIGDYGITTTRKKKVDFSAPYFTTHFVFLSKNYDEVDLINKKIGIEKATNAEDYLSKQNLGKTGHVIIFNSITDAIININKNKVDYLLIKKEIFNDYLKKNPDTKIKIISNDILEEEAGIVVKKGNIELLKIIDDGLQKAKIDGTYLKLFNKYFN